MKAIVFGGTGFIGSHVVEQLHLAGHEVTAAVRNTSDTTFLDQLGVQVVRVNFSNFESIGKAIDGNQVVYNCTADSNLIQATLDAPVEIKLTRTLIEAAAYYGATRFIQLSTIVVYDFLSDEPIDESYDSRPEYPIQNIGLEREKVVVNMGRETGIETIVLRPASTIGVRDQKSFFARLFSAHKSDLYPMIGSGSTKVSIVDTRDIGRAMVWLGTYKKTFETENRTFLLKGFDTTWGELKTEIDNATGKVAKILEIPETLTEEQMMAYHLNPFALKTFTVYRIWNDTKIRSLGFETKYSLNDAVETEVRDLLSRSF
jgi:dihydroflavonol-4-reductase